MANAPFHDPQGNPLPDANDIEHESARGIDLYSLQDKVPTRSPSPHIKQDIRRLRNIFIGLVIVGGVLGSVASVGVVFILKRAGLLDPPSAKEMQIYRRSNDGARETIDFKL